MISQKYISKLSNRLLMNNKRITETVIEKDYIISWILIGLSESNLKKDLIFKGGTCLKKCFIPDYRFSEDLDFTLRTTISMDKIIEEFSKISQNILSQSGVVINIDENNIFDHKNTFTFFINYKGPLPARKGKRIKTDCTIKEIIVNNSDERNIITYPEFIDLPINKTIFTYNIEEIGSEKIIALLDNARNEPRDLYDIWYLSYNKFIIIYELKSIIEKKCEFRKIHLSNIMKNLELKKSRLRKTWQSRLENQILYLPEFETVYRYVKRELRQTKWNK